MNKLLLRQNARNHIKIFPMKDLFELPEDEGDKIRWCEEKFKLLQHSDNAVRTYLQRNNKKGYLISVWQLGELFYLVNCIRTNTQTYVTTIYITKDGLDANSIAKFLYENVSEIMNDTKQSLLDYYKTVVKINEEQRERDS